MNCDISKLSYFSLLILPGRGITLNLNLIASALSNITAQTVMFDNAFAIMSEECSTISFINICSNATSSKYQEWLFLFRF